MRNNKSVLWIIMVTVALLISLFVLGRNLKQENQNNLNQVFCAQDTLQCPDGSFVGRVPPSCEFAQCSVTSTTSQSGASPTKTFADIKQGVSFEYIDNFYLNNNLTEYVLPVEWPPSIRVSTSTYICRTGASSTNPNALVSRKTINGKIYCLTTASEGAAGSVFTTYDYKVPVQGKTVEISFVTRSPQCGNFDEPQKSECENEKKIFSIDNLIEKIFASVKFI